MKEILIIGAIVLGMLGLLPVIVSVFLRDVEAGTIGKPGLWRAC